jgi:hypothetical protein
MKHLLLAIAISFAGGMWVMDIYHMNRAVNNSEQIAQLAKKTEEEVRILTEEIQKLRNDLSRL